MKKIKLEVKNNVYDLNLDFLENSVVKVDCNDKSSKIEIEKCSSGTVLKCGDKNYAIAVNHMKPEYYEIFINGERFVVQLKSNIITSQENFNEKINNINISKIISSPMVGTISLINCKSGQKIKKGEHLFSVIAMKMENKIFAKDDGIVKEVFVKADDRVNERQKVIEFK